MPDQPVTALREDYDRLKQEVDEAKRLNSLLVILKNLEPILEKIEDVVNKVRDSFPKLLEHPKVQIELVRLRSEAVKHVRYVYLNRKPKPGGPANNRWSTD